MSLAIPKEFVDELKSSGITNAVIVDDLFEPPSSVVVPTLSAFWTSFTDDRAVHPELELIFKDVNSVEEVDDSHIQRCWEVRNEGKSKSLLDPLFKDYADRKAELTELSRILSDIFGTQTIELTPDAEIPDQARLVFLDYYLGEGPETAHSIAKRLAERKHLRPYLVLISDAPNLKIKSEGFRRETGYIAGTFAHLEKEKAINPAELAYSLASWGLGNSALRVIQPLFDAMIASVDEAAKDVKAAMAAVTIQDYSFLQNLSLSGDGHPLGEYIVDLFGLSLSYHFRDSKAIKAARTLADQTPFKKHLPLSMVPSHLIVELYRQALTEPLVEERIAEHPWCSDKTKSVIEEAIASEVPAPAMPVPSSPAVGSTEPVKVHATEGALAIKSTTNISAASPPEVPLDGVVSIAVAEELTKVRVNAGQGESVKLATTESIKGIPSAAQEPGTLLIQPSSNGVEPKAPAAPAITVPLATAKDTKTVPFDENAIAWLSTGDIFLKNETEPLLMVLNAGCDLQFAPYSKRKAQPNRSILLIEGNIYSISNLQPPDEIARTEFFKIGTTLYRINWTDRVRTIKHADFKATMETNGYEKRIARLSLPYVLQVQQAWLASLGRVGVPVAPPHSGSNDIEIYVSVDKVPFLKTRISHGAIVFRVKQTKGYVSEFLLSKETVTAVRQLLREIINAWVKSGSDKLVKKAENLTKCLQTFDFWRALQEKPRPFTKDTVSIENGILKACFNESVTQSDFADTQIVLRFAEHRS